MQFTTEEIKSLYLRVKEYGFAKYGSTVESIRIDSDGDIEMEFYDTHNDSYSHYVTAEELTADLEVIAKERLAEIERKRLEAIERQRLQAIAAAEVAAKERYATYLKLKNEFGN